MEADDDNWNRAIWSSDHEGQVESKGQVARAATVCVLSFQRKARRRGMNHGDPEFDLERMKPEGVVEEGHRWHGWRMDGDPDGYSIHIGNLPGRKKVALYMEDDDHFKVLAYFQSDEAAEEMAEWVDRLQEAVNENAAVGGERSRA